MNIETIIREYINKSLHLSLATTNGDKPWVCEVHFVYDDNLNLYFRSLESRRHSQEIANNPNVAGNIVAQHTIDEYPHAIYFEGSAQIMTDINEIKAVVPLFQERLGRQDDIVAESQTPDGHKFYKITVENWYAFGKFGQEKGDKYTLSWNGGNK